jgi:putative transposase
VRPFKDLDDKEWALIEALFAPARETQAPRGRRPVETRVVVNAIVWLLTTEAGWNQLPGHYPSLPTCRRRFELWRTDGTLVELVRRLNAGGRRLPMQTRGRALQPAPPASQPLPDRLRGVFWINPERWRVPPAASSQSS